MAGAKSVVFVEAASAWVIGVLHAVVPLAKSPGGIARRLEGIRDGLFVEIQALLPEGDSVHAAAQMIAASEKLGACR
jgi:hypothetical protein